MKVKDVNVSRGRKYSNNYQSVDYHIGITIEGEEEDDIEDMRDYAITNLMAMETQEEIRCSLVIEEVKAEQIAEFKNNFSKPKNTEQFNKEILNENEKLIQHMEKLEQTEDIIMDLKEVTVMAKTDLSLLVAKKGYQKWVAFSLMPLISKDDYEPGEYIENIAIKEDKRVWFNEKKSWDKLQVVKK